MPHSVPLITTLAVALGLALLLGFLAQRTRLPPVVGYLLAGIIIGPHTPGFVADLPLAQQLAEIGVMLLMFGVGLHFSLDDLRAVRRIALPGALAQITVATGLGVLTAWLWGWGIGAGLVFGLALSVASTVVLLKALEARGQLTSTNGRIAVGWLVVEDLVTVLVLVLLPPLAAWLGSDGADPAQGLALLGELGITLFKVAAFALLMFALGGRVLPWLLWQVARTHSRELFTLCVIAAALGIAYAASAVFGVSFALGAFVAGMVLGKSALSHRAAADSLPLRDAFAVLFFVAVGMLFDPAMLIEEPLRVLAVVAIIMLGKSLAAFLLVLALRYPLNTALTVSASLAQIGEFSFILAGLGVALGLLPEAGQTLILAGAMVSIALNPLVFRAIEPLQSWIRARSRLARRLERNQDPLAALPMSVDLQGLTGHLLLVGAGGVGQRLLEQVREQGVALVVAEQNRERVAALRGAGVAAVCGDAADPMVLVQAHVARAGAMVITVADTLRAGSMIEIARTLHPQIRICALARSAEEQAWLLRNGADAAPLDVQVLSTALLEAVGTGVNAGPGGNQSPCGNGP